jgi:hypothetical protein
MISFQGLSSGNICWPRKVGTRRDSSSQSASAGRRKRGVILDFTVILNGIEAIAEGAAIAAIADGMRVVQV